MPAVMLSGLLVWWFWCKLKANPISIWHVSPGCSILGPCWLWLSMKVAMTLLR